MLLPAMGCGFTLYLGMDNHTMMQAATSNGLSMADRLKSAGVFGNPHFAFASLPHVPPSKLCDDSSDNGYVLLPHPGSDFTPPRSRACSISSHLRNFMLFILVYQHQGNSAPRNTSPPPCTNFFQATHNAHQYRSNHPFYGATGAYQLSSKHPPHKVSPIMSPPSINGPSDP